MSRWEHHSWRSLHQTNIAIECNRSEWRSPFFQQKHNYALDQLAGLFMIFECSVNRTSCHISRVYIDSDCQPPTGFRSDWWKDLRLWRCWPQIVTSMFPGCFKDLPGFSTTYLTVLKWFEYVGMMQHIEDSVRWTNKLAESDFEEPTQIDARKIKYYLGLDWSRVNMTFVIWRFSDNYKIWEILKAPAARFGLHAKSSTASTCIRAGTAIWTIELWSRP